MSLKDKASKINFAGLPGSTPVAASTLGQDLEPRRPRTAPGAMMEFAQGQRSDLLRENEALREQAGRADELRGKLDAALADLQSWDGAKAARLIDPQRVRRSRFANRHERNFAGQEFADLKAEIASAGGNVQPIKVRPVGSGDYEVVFGHRRLQACVELGLPVLAVVDNIDDRSLFVEMDRENRSRKDLSAWEQGVMYRRALTEGLFPSNRKLAEAVGADLSAVGKALSLADLPVEVVEAFSSPLEIQFRWAKPLKDALDADQGAVVQRAKAIRKAGATLAPKEVFARLIGGAGEGVEPFHPPQSSDLMLDGRRAGTLLFNPKGGVSLTLIPGMVTPESGDAFLKAVEAFLQSAK